MAEVNIAGVTKTYGATQVIHGVDCRIADGDYPIPYLGVIAVPPSHIGKRLAAIDLEEGDVGLLVAADHLRRVPAVFLKDYRHLVGVGDDMVVGCNVAGGVDDEPGAERVDAARAAVAVLRITLAALPEMIEDTRVTIQTIRAAVTM